MSEPLLLAVLTHPALAPAVLAAAGQMHTRYSSIRVIACHLRPEIEPGFMPTEEVMTEDREQRFQTAQDAVSQSLSRTFSGWQAEEGAAQWASWQEVVGEPDRRLLDLGRAATLVVMAHPAAEPHSETKKFVKLLPGAGHFAIKRINPGGGSVAEALLDAAVLVEADLLVMGGYTHNTLLEAMLGGVTREMLARAEIPLLMCH